MKEICKTCEGIGEVICFDDDLGSQVSVCPKCRGCGMFRHLNQKAFITMRDFFNNHMTPEKIDDLVKKYL